MQDSSTTGSPESVGASALVSSVHRASITRRRAFITLAVVVGGSAALAAGVAASAASRRLSDDRGHIAAGVRVADVPVGGLTVEEAKERVRVWARERVQKPVTLVAPVSERRWNIPLAEVGGRFETGPAIDRAFQIGKDETFWDQLLHGGKSRAVRIEPEFRFNEALLNRQLEHIAKTVARPARNARARMGGGGVVTVVAPEDKGVALDVAATRAALLKNGVAGLRNGATAPLVIHEQKPAVTAADLGRVSSLIGSFHTGYGSSSANRRHNVETAAAHIDGTMLAPGETFSYNAVVGPRTRKLGWLDAPTYQDGQVVPGPGGGVCQVSTTLYNAALRAGMKIVRRSHHSMPVHYVNPGCDATVAYDDIDFQFQNTSDAPVLISGRTEKGVLAFNLYGAPFARPRTVEVVSADTRPAPQGGFTVTTFRVTHFGDGATERERLSTDTYMPLVKKSSPAARVHPKPGPSPVNGAVTKKPAAAPSPAPSAPAATTQDEAPA